MDIFMETKSLYLEHVIHCPVRKLQQFRSLKKKLVYSCVKYFSLLTAWNDYRRIMLSEFQNWNFEHFVPLLRCFELIYATENFYSLSLQIFNFKRGPSLE